MPEGRSVKGVVCLGEASQRKGVTEKRGDELGRGVPEGCAVKGER